MVFPSHIMIKTKLSYNQIVSEMDAVQLKKKFEALWKDTFHDSDGYISLIFDNYFDPQLVAYAEEDSHLIAGLIGIPYEFGNASRSLRGLMLCGLYTRQQYRGRGVMTRLLAEINAKAAEAGFAFTFLIPANPGLQKYYRDRDYVNAFYRVVDNYTSLHDFDRDYESELMQQKEKVATLKRKYYESLSAGYIDGNTNKNNIDKISSEIKLMIRSIEDVQDDFQIIHSDKDLDIILRENAMSRGEVHYVKNSAERITAVAFITIEDSVVAVQKLYSADLASKYKVLGSVKKRYPEIGIKHYVSSIEMDRKALWWRTYGSFMGEAPQAGEISITERVYSLAAHAKVYGMTRILNLHEILKFQAEGRHDLKYSILTKSDDPAILEQIDVKGGRLSVKKIPIENLSASQTAHLMSKRDVCEILFRRRDTDNMITEAFGIPSINAAAALMFD